VDRNSVNELANAPESALSFLQRAADLLELDYTFLTNVRLDTYHVPIVRRQLTQNLPFFIDLMMDELEAAFQDEFIVNDGSILRRESSNGRLDTICGI
jgi:hypothetical protein